MHLSILQREAVREIEKDLDLYRLPGYIQTLHALAYLLQQAQVSGLPDSNHAVQHARRILGKLNHPIGGTTE